MAKRKIDMQIALQGGDDVAKQFAELGRAGEQAFARVRAAANDNKNIDLNLPKLKREIEEVGKAGQQAFQSIGGAAGQASQQVNQQTGFFSSLAGRITIVAGSLTALVAGYLAAAKAASETVVALGRQADAARLSITNFLQLRGTLQQLNLTEDEGARAADKLRTALQTAFDEGKKALEDFGVKFAPVTAQTQKFGAEMEVFGTKFVSGRTAAHSLAEAIQALTIAQTNGRVQISETSRALLAMQAVFDPLTGKIREGAAAWIPFAEGVRRMKDQTAAARLVNNIFGEDIGRVLLPAIRAGNDEFVRAFDSIQRLNLGFTDAQRKVGQDMVNAFARLKLATSQARTEFGLAFAPVFTPAVNAFADAIRRNQATITQFVNQLVTFAKPAIDAFFKAITQFVDRPASFDTLRDNIVAVGTAIAQIFRNVVVPAFTAFGKAATSVATAVGNLFGIEISPALVGLGAIVTALIGPFNALALAIAAVFGGEGKQFDDFRKRLLAMGIDIEGIKTRLSGIFDAVVAQLPGIISSLASAFEGLMSTLDTVAGLINSIFGTELTGAGLAAIAIVAQLTGGFDLLRNVLGVTAAAFGVAAAASFVLVNVFKLLTLMVLPGGPLVVGLIALGTLLVVALGGFEATLNKFTEVMDKAGAQTDRATAEAAERQRQHHADVQSDLEAIKAFFSSTWDSIVSAVSSAWDTIVSGAQSFAGRIGSAIAGLVGRIVDPFRRAVDAIIELWDTVINKIREAIGFGSQAAPGGGGGGFASGGYTGNGRTRQIAGFVHGGEYVQPARVVRQPGVLAFMETLRHVGDLRKAIQLFARGFSVGGLVDNFSARLSGLAIPQFASGGLVPAGGRVQDFGTVMLDMGQGHRVRILTDAESVAALRRFAIKTQILSAGREN